MGKEIFIYVNENDVKITKEYVTIPDYKIICSISIHGSMEDIQSWTCMYIHNNMDLVSCGFYVESKRLDMFYSSDKNHILSFKNKSMSKLYKELFDKFVIIYDNDIVDNCEISYEIFYLVNIINRCINKYHNEYFSFIEKISNDIPFKALPKSAIN